MSNPANKSDIFATNGQQLHIYVAARVEGHAQLLRALWKAGARTTSSPLESQIILVEPGTEDATTLMTSFSDKIILDVEWAHESLRRGVYPSFKEAWGGFLLQSPPLDGQGDPLSTGLPNTSSTASSHQVLTALSRALGAFSQTNQSFNAYPPGQAFCPPTTNMPSVPPPVVPQTGQLSSNPHEILTLVGQLLSQAGYSGNTLSTQYEAHQWPSHGVSSSAGPSTLPNSTPTSHLPTHTGNSQSLADVIAHQFATPPRPSSSHKRKSWAAGSPNAAAIERSSPVGSAHLQTRDAESEQEDPSDRKPFHARPSSQSSYISRRRRVFRDADGEPLSFYVLPSMKRRSEAVDIIKKYGGHITAEVSDSDFVVLATNADHFHETLRTAVALDVPAVKLDFVMECVTTGSLLDPEDFSFEGETVKRKRGPPQTISLAEIRNTNQTEKKRKRSLHKVKEAKKPRGRVEKDVARSGHKYEESDNESMESIVAEAETEFALDGARGHEGKAPDEEMDPSLEQQKQNMKVHTAPEASASSSRSPSPVAPLTVVRSRGGYQFTSEEKEYWPKYVEHVFKSDPESTRTKLAQGLSQKMPHHSVASWSSVILAHHTDSIEALRKKAYISIRQKRARAQNLQSEVTESSRRKMPLPRRSATTPTAADADLEHDFEVITTFLVDGGAENISDEEVWNVLQSKYECRTHPSWELFWGEHGTAVTERVEERALHTTYSKVKVKVEKE